MMQNKFLNNRSFLRQLASGVHYTATSPGPYRLLFIAIHGNESCGVEAYLKISSKIPNLLQDGSLEVRLGNPVAFLLNQRSFNKDLNRCFTVSDIPQYETKRCKTLINSLQKSDLFLDIHSTSAWSIVSSTKQKWSVFVPTITCESGDSWSGSKMHRNNTYCN